MTQLNVPFKFLHSFYPVKNLLNDRKLLNVLGFVVDKKKILKNSPCPREGSQVVVNPRTVC